jgi:glycosyltransferase involved in cell wall biosynthesis
MAKQKISVCIIAHNEEALIERCLRSIEKQTTTPDEVVLIAHNCTDATEARAKQFSWLTVIPYSGPVGCAYARAEGFRRVQGEIILCTDADTELPPNWVQKVAEEFKDPRVVAVGTFVIYSGAIFSTVNSCLVMPILYVRSLFNDSEFFGPSFAVRKQAYESINGLNALLAVKEKIGLSYWVDDLYISYMLAKRGRVTFLPSVVAFARLKEQTFKSEVTRLRLNIKDRALFFKEFAERS